MASMFEVGLVEDRHITFYIPEDLVERVSEAGGTRSVSFYFEDEKYTLSKEAEDIYDGFMNGDVSNVSADITLTDEAEPYFTLTEFVDTEAY